MIKVYQDKFVHIHGTGNCRNACIASLMELPLREVSDILPSDPGDWHAKWNIWLANRGLKLATYLVKEEGGIVPDGFSIASVMTTRRYPEGHRYAGRNISHAVIMFNGELFHDPYPGGSEITQIKYYEVLRPMTASEMDSHRTKSKYGFCMHGYRLLCKQCGSDIKDDSKTIRVSFDIVRQNGESVHFTISDIRGISEDEILKTEGALYKAFPNSPICRVIETSQ